MKIAGEGSNDPSALLIYRALQGNSGKVEIGGRRYTFSCIPTFRLTDERSGRVHDVRDSSGLLQLIQELRLPAKPRADHRSQEILVSGCSEGCPPQSTSSPHGPPPKHPPARGRKAPRTLPSAG